MFCHYSQGLSGVVIFARVSQLLDFGVSQLLDFDTVDEILFDTKYFLEKKNQSRKATQIITTSNRPMARMISMPGNRAHNPWHFLTSLIGH